MRPLEIAEVAIESACIDGAIKVIEKVSSNELKRVEIEERKQFSSTVS